MTGKSIRATPAFASMLAVISCSSPSTDEQAVQEVEVVKWDEAPGGGLIAYREDDPQSGQVTRCWEIGEDHTCLRVAGGDTQMVQVNAFRSDKPILFPPWNEKDRVGFNCTVFINEMGDAHLVEEAISNERGTLWKHTFEVPTSAYETAWTRGEVEDFMEANKLAVKRPWFNCGQVGVAMANGSFETLGTTKITYDRIFN